VSIVASLFFLFLSVPGGVAAQASPVQGDGLIPIAPCRILDTSVLGAAAASSRQVDVRATRCGRVVPQFADALAVQVTRVRRQAPEKQPPGVGPVREPVRRVPLTGNGQLSFATPHEDVVGVDVVGYYVPPGTPAIPRTSASSVDEGLALRASSDPAPASSIVHTGASDVGSIYLNGGLWSAAGVAMVANAEAPWITASLGTSNGSSAFMFRNSAAELMRLRSDGVVQLSSNAFFFDGRTDFFGAPGSYPGYVSIPTNVVHDVTLVNPYDGAGGQSSRVTFFNAATDDEWGSPSITKFRARTGGYHAQENVNFDSTFHWHHQPNQFHFRAVSSAENKPTFWVKAATSGDSLAQTRADMYVSGRTGLGTSAPAAALHVEDLTNHVEVIVSAGDNPGTANSPTLTLMRKDGGNTQLAKYGLKLDSADGNRFKLLYKTTVDTEDTTLLTVDPNGTLTARVVGAVYQDVAEWVPSNEPLTDATVVIVAPDADDHVVASTQAYDTRVAGVVSPNPGILLGVAGDGKFKIATTGRVKVKVDASAHAIARGDLLVTSAKPGVAMKSTPLEVGGAAIHRPGTLIGKALEPLATGEGEILVLLSLQ
jgi:hypothetical protein